MKPLHSAHDKDNKTQNTKRSTRAPFVRAFALGVALLVIGFALGLGASRLFSATRASGPSKDTVAVYQFDGSTHSVTAEDVKASQFGAEQSSGSEPTADNILQYSRNQILLKEAEKRKITVDENDLSNYALTYLGSSDFSQIAGQYDVSESEAKEIVRQNAILQALYEQVVFDGSTMKLPQMPEEPDDGDYESSSPDYAAYIIKLAGSEWDASSGGWARTDGPYYDALKDEDFSEKSATYSQALLAYNVAYQEYTEAASGNNDKWYSFINDLYKNASIEIFSLEA